jgi:predicted DNA-binding transcriptional regulator AlpA
MRAAPPSTFANEQPNDTCSDPLKAATPSPSNHSMLTAQQLAERWQVSVRHINREVQCGTVPAPVRLGRCVRWPLAVIQKAEAAWSEVNSGKGRRR